MGLIRRDTNATAEADSVAGDTPATTVQPTQAPAPAPAAAPAPAPTPTAHPKSGDALADAPTGAPGHAQATNSATMQGKSATPETTALVRREANAGAVVSFVGNALDDLKNAFTVDWDTFERLKSGSGNIVDSNNNSLGDEIELTVLSFQDTYDVSPGSDAPEAKKVVRFSDDGVEIRETGELVRDYLDKLRNGEVDGVKYPNAAMKKKMVVVGILEASAKPSNLLGRTVQVSLSSQSMKTFDRHRFDYTVAAKLGRLAKNAPPPERISIKAEARSSNGRNYTLLIVSAATAEA